MEHTLERTLLYHPGVKLLTGMVSLLFSMLFVTGMVLSLLDGRYNSRQYIFTYIFSSVIGIMFATMLLFIVTCISSLVIMIVNTTFSMRNLFCVVYCYYGKSILLNSILLYLFYLGKEVNTGMTIAVYLLFTLLFLVQYYQDTVKCAGVKKTAAMLLLGVTLLVNLVVIVPRVIIYI